MAGAWERASSKSWWRFFLRIAEIEIENLMNADGEETGLDLSSGCAAEKRLPATRRPVEQNATPDLLAVGLKELRILQRVDDLHPDLLL